MRKEVGRPSFLEIIQKEEGIPVSAIDILSQRGVYHSDPQDPKLQNLIEVTFSRTRKQLVDSSHNIYSLPSRRQYVWLRTADVDKYGFLPPDAKGEIQILPPDVQPLAATLFTFKTGGRNELMLKPPLSPFQTAVMRLLMRRYPENVSIKEMLEYLSGQNLRIIGRKKKVDIPLKEPEAAEEKKVYNRDHLIKEICLIRVELAKIDTHYSVPNTENSGNYKLVYSTGENADYQAVIDAVLP